MTNAPVCNINPPLPGAEPQVSPLPAIPVATDLQSAIQAINTMRQIIQAMTNQNSNNNNNNRFPNRITSTKQNADFQEISAKRITKETKITDPNDSSVFVKVKQITGLTFLNKVTGQEISWKQ